MKISDLIQRLVVLENLYGDIEVKLLQSAIIHSQEHRWQANITEVESDVEQESNTVIITIY